MIADDTANMGDCSTSSLSSPNRVVRSKWPVRRSILSSPDAFLSFSCSSFRCNRTKHNQPSQQRLTLSRSASEERSRKAKRKSSQVGIELLQSASARWHQVSTREAEPRTPIARSSGAWLALCICRCIGWARRLEDRCAVVQCQIARLV